MGQTLFAVGRVMIITTWLFLLGGILQVQGWTNGNRVKGWNNVAVIDKCFMLVKEKVSWSEAKARCRSIGAFLAMPKDNWTNNYLKAHLRKLTDHSVWFGLHEMSNGWSTLMAPRWDTQTGAEVSPTMATRTRMAPRTAENLERRTTFIGMMRRATFGSTFSARRAGVRTGSGAQIIICDSH